ncbi:hypothetical protein [Thermocrinis sp.]|jgi:hypothetical protein|uniref:hypothetical protein n=1 Tax=Thermocrinis sp. TaxID=2024383 RepID=UPI003BFD86E0
MEKREILLRLCEELTKEAENLYDKFEVVLCHITAAVAWADRKLQEDVMLTVNDGFSTLEQSRLRRLSEEISKIVKEFVQDREEGKEKREGKGEGKKEILLRLCKELTKAVEYFYHEEDAGLKAHLGEVLVRYGSLLSNIGWAITWASEDVQDKVFRIIEDALERKHLLKCRLEEWLSWKVGEAVDSALEDKEEEKETKTQTITDELPF